MAKWHSGYHHYSQLHSKELYLRFYAGLNPACSMLEVCTGEKMAWNLSSSAG